MTVYKGADQVAGVYVGATGFAKLYLGDVSGSGPPPDYVRSDKFTRANTAGGSLGAPVPADAIAAFANDWTFVAGSGPYGLIRSNRYTTDPAAPGTPNVYARQTLAEGNVYRVESLIDVRGSIGPGVPPASTATIIICPVDFNSGVHLQINPYSMYLDYLTTGGVPNNIVPQTPYNSYTPIGTVNPLKVVALFDAAGNYDIRFTSLDFPTPLVVTGQSNNLIGRFGPNLFLQCLQSNANHAVQHLQVKAGIKQLGA